MLPARISPSLISPVPSPSLPFFSSSSFSNYSSKIKRIQTQFWTKKGRALQEDNKSLSSLVSTSKLIFYAFHIVSFARGKEGKHVEFFFLFENFCIPNKIIYKFVDKEIPVKIKYS